LGEKQQQEEKEKKKERREGGGEIAKKKSVCVRERERERKKEEEDAYRETKNIITHCSHQSAAIFGRIPRYESTGKHSKNSQRKASKL